jgi:hypothetical protein
LFNLAAGCDAGSASTGKFLKVKIYKNAVLGGPVNFQYTDSSRSLIASDIAATSVSAGPRTQTLKEIIVAANDSVILKLLDENFYISNGDTITVAVQRGGSSDVDNALISVSWFEDQ